MNIIECSKASEDRSPHMRRLAKSSFQSNLKPDGERGGRTIEVSHCFNWVIMLVCNQRAEETTVRAWFEKKR